MAKRKFNEETRWQTYSDRGAGILSGIRDERRPKPSTAASAGRQLGRKWRGLKNSDSDALNEAFSYFEAMMRNDKKRRDKEPEEKLPEVSSPRAVEARHLFAVVSAMEAAVSVATEELFAAQEESEAPEPDVTFDEYNSYEALELAANHVILRRGKKNKATVERKTPTLTEVETLHNPTDVYATERGVFVLPVDNEGYPDRFYFLGDRLLFAVEFKMPGKHPDARQASRILELRQRGIATYIVKTVEDFKKILDKYL
jgi:hypothetical protein